MPEGCFDTLFKRRLVHGKNLLLEFYLQVDFMSKMLVCLAAIFLYSSSLSAASIETRQKRDNGEGNLDGEMVESTPLSK